MAFIGQLSETPNVPEKCLLEMKKHPSPQKLAISQCYVFEKISDIHVPRLFYDFSIFDINYAA